MQAERFCRPVGAWRIREPPAPAAHAAGYSLSALRAFVSPVRKADHKERVRYGLVNGAAALLLPVFQPSAIAK